MRRRAQIFYGWVIVAVATFALVVSNGLSIGGLPVFYRWLREDLVAAGAVAADRAESFIAFGASLTFLFSGLISPLAGWLIQKFPLRSLMLAGCVLLGGGLVLLATAGSAPQVYAARILMGISLGFVGVLPSVVLVSNWFVRKRGTALGILLTGTSVGGVIIPPMATPLIDRYGWRTAMLVVSLLIWLVLAPLVAFLVRTRPAEIGLEADGETGHTDAPAPESSHGMTFREAIRTPVFWIFAIGAALIFYPIFVTSQQLILQTAKIGFTAWQGTFVLSGLFAVSVVGKFLFGYLSDRFAPVRVILVCTSIMFLSTFLLLDLNSTTAFLFLIPFGLGYGGAFVLIQRLVADFFGDRDYPKILGAITIGDTLGAVLGGMVTGWLADRAGGDYTAGFYGVIAAAGIALALMVVLNLSAKRFTDLVRMRSA
ncbi:MAG TPA: MFS transporter [Pyrinomonadaceae bacterium]|nr:MFS transporter [Pyrinomonadaceae bacterium]